LLTFYRLASREAENARLKTCLRVAREKNEQLERKLEAARLRDQVNAESAQDAENARLRERRKDAQVRNLREQLERAIAKLDAAEAEITRLREQCARSARCVLDPLNSFQNLININLLCN
jgi:hypothetical protein